MKTLEVTDIKKIVPHRYPMLLLDRVVFLIPGEKAVGLHNVSFSENFVQASSSDDPHFPRSLIVEAMAQTGAVALLAEDKFAKKTAYFGGIQKSEFFGDAKPGDQMIIETELTKIKKNIGLGQGVVKVKDKVIAKAELTFMIG